MNLKMTKEQKEAFKKLSEIKVGALFMKMGTGKTKVAIDLVEYNNCDILIYLTPFSTKNNIEKEFKKWNMKTQYYILAYETLSSSDREYLKVLDLLKNKKVFIIADESIFIKNDETKRFTRACKLRSLCEYALILNGTPLTKTEYDLYNQMYFLSPKIIGMTKEEFKNNFYKKIEYKKAFEKPKVFYKFSKRNADVLYKMIEPYIFKCDLNFSLKESTIKSYVPYSETDYYIIKEKFFNKFIKNGNIEDILALLNKLNFIASTYEEKNKEVIYEAKNKQVIVFCNYLNEVEYYKNNMDCYIITGSTKKDTRTKIIEQFRNDNKPLVLTFGVGSYSLNLQFCNKIIYSSINFDFGKIEQSQYRIKRMGQEKEIEYRYILSDLGIVKLIERCIQRKESINDLIKDNMMKGDTEWLKNI